MTKPPRKSSKPLLHESDAPVRGRPRRRRDPAQPNLPLDPRKRAEIDTVIEELRVQIVSLERQQAAFDMVIQAYGPDRPRPSGVREANGSQNASAMRLAMSRYICYMKENRYQE